MTRQEIKALDAEMASLEKQISDNMNMNEINRIQERVISLKLEKQRLLSVDAMAAPADLRAQIEAIDTQISAVELQVRDAVTRLTNPDPLYSRLTNLKLQKQELLSKLPTMDQVSQ